MLIISTDWKILRTLKINRGRLISSFFIDKFTENQYNINMSLLKKLQHKKKLESAERLEEVLLDSEAIPPKQPSLEECLKMHPEGEYVLTENGLCLRYVMYEPVEYKIANKHELPKLIEKSKKGLQKAQEVINKELEK